MSHSQEQSNAKESESRKISQVFRMAGRAALGLSLAATAGAGFAYKDEIEQRVTPEIEFSISDPLVKSLSNAELLDVNKPGDNTDSYEILPTDIPSFDEAPRENQFLDGINS